MSKNFLQDGLQGHDASDPQADLEEQYMRLFPKIGRDFIYREDLFKIIRAVMAVIDPLGLSPIDIDSKSEARRKALEYKSLLDSGESRPDRYTDLIKLDE